MRLSDFPAEQLEKVDVRTLIGSKVRKNTSRTSQSVKGGGLRRKEGDSMSNREGAAIGPIEEINHW